MQHPKINVKIKLMSKADGLPEYKTVNSSGVDLYATRDSIIYKFNKDMVGTGIMVDIPAGYEAQVRSRSGLAAKHNLFVLNTPGTIDSDYRGEIQVILFNLGDEDHIITKGDRIAQLVFCPIVQAEFEQVDELSKTVRGAGGIGSTGV